ncbi:hypothetical protein [Methylibium sp.]|uniref:hypothetical protein n=1 Tax=Methylibium sp. TaxID=2067992 RepID=UPI003D0EFE06
MNILLRAITGPYDSPQGDALGDKKRRRVPADRHWFRARVPDDAVNATVIAKFSIGEHKFETLRSLANLDLKSLSVDNREWPDATAAELEAAYQQQVIEASQLASFDDFLFLLRYVIFFLEDRRSLVWDSAAQGDILGILFGDQATNRLRYVEVFNDLLSKDSEYRNMFAVVSSRRRQYEKQASSIEGGHLERVQQQLHKQLTQLTQLREEKERYAEERDSLREQIETRGHEVFEQRAVLARELDDFYKSFFPQVPDAARYLLSYFEAQAGCLICGTRSEEAMSRVNGKLQMNTCPVCESPIEHATKPQHDPYAGENIEIRRAAIVRLEQELNSMQEPLKAAEANYAKTVGGLARASSEVSSLEQQLRALGDSLPNAKERRDKVHAQLSSFQTALDAIEAERQTLALEFRELAEAIDKDVQGVSAQVESAFARFISGFLAETCRIAYTARQSRIGQRSSTESFPFPHFIPALTSGVHRLSATVREQGQSVSESQKEFIDLAFRMALLEVAAPDSPSMLILETPEASLDSVFVPRAADLLRRFATREEEAVAQTRLIASSNINREYMIPALFGAYPDKRFEDQVKDRSTDPPPPAVPIDQREFHVVDLLKVAAPTTALDRFRQPYESERDRAIYPERYAAP